MRLRFASAACAFVLALASSACSDGTAPELRRIAFDEEYVSEISSSGDFEEVLVDIEGGTTFSVRFSVPGERLRLMLFEAATGAPVEELLGENDDVDGEPEWTTPITTTEDATYRVRVETFEGTTGEYSLLVTEAPVS